MSLVERLVTALGGPPSSSGSNLPVVQGFGGEFTSLDDPYLAQFLLSGRLTKAGVEVSRHSALRNATFYRAITLICNSIGMLPMHLMRQAQEAADGKPAVLEKASDHPLFSILHRKPNEYQTPFEFKTFMQAELLFEGSAFAYVKRDAIQRPKWLIPLPSNRIMPKLSDDFTISFEYNHPKGGPRTIRAQDMLWIRGPVSPDGVNATSIVQVAAEALGLASAAETAQGAIFRNGSLVGGVLEHPKTLTAPAIERLRNQFEERHAGAENAHKWIVAEEGLQAKPLGTTGKDAQAVEARRLQVEEIGRFMGVPRPLLMMDETSWGSGIEQLGLFFITYCLMPYFVMWEQAIERSLLAEKEQGKMFAKFNEGALLRGSLKDQAEFFSKALGSGGAPGWMSQNEVRDKANLPPVEGGDEVSKGSAAKQPEPGSGEGEDEEANGDNRPPQE